jgi:hypothetical protein
MYKEYNMSNCLRYAYVTYKVLPNVDSAVATDGGPVVAGVVEVVVELLVVVVVVELVVLLSLKSQFHIE